MGFRQRRGKCQRRAKCQKTDYAVIKPPARQATLTIGDIEVANRVLLAPMSGITDAPFRRITAELGAGLVVSEMTASDDLARGRPMSVLRCEATGIGPHVVQLAGCETPWMAEGARIAERVQRSVASLEPMLSSPA